MLQMHGPCTTPLAEGLKNMRYLNSIKMSDCHGITRIPDLSGLTSLEYLELCYFRDLVEVDPSVGRLNKLLILRLTRCFKLQMFLKGINLKSLETLDLSGCPLKFFPEIEGDMKSLNHLELSETHIKELPCSVGNLTGLKSLSLTDCHHLTNVPSSIFYALQCLEYVGLGYCYELVTFPTKSESLPPPNFSTNLTRLQVYLYGCYGLEEISEFPREIDGLDVERCESLERISKLSKILEGKDSKMFSSLELADCQTLCDNLARGVGSEVHVAKNGLKMTSEELIGEAEKLTALLTLFFSCPKSEEFQVQFPTSAPIPSWFTCRQDVNWDVDSDVNWEMYWGEVYSEVIHKEHELCIEIPQNSNWDNRGLAFCVQLCSAHLTCFVYINGIKFDKKDVLWGNVWVHYIPLVTVIRRLSENGMPPPDMFRVMFRFEENVTDSAITMKVSWGVHLIEDLEGKADDSPADFQ
ncbi:putative leucine-rich repeat domain, L domain-containing protein [Rosa chinensis]|uniref:Putative leucine-rich repeat domain, L domain-containing protein n=2 Tax=Rosa chinensis TaxID=74649 RepID=A0A2P6PPR5_ROSCH|nr:putative leucine-rich repeat domain, L domain-containing protein [Rosa chinensis]